MQRGEYPYKNIGERLKKWRERAHESVDEVSGAVEIDSDQLRKIEKGIVLPSEDILLLLVSHFGVIETEAQRLFEQAGYARDARDINTDEQLIKQMLMIIPFDNRILYSDSVTISANNDGLVMEFLQKNANPQPTVIGRIGMSLDQAQKTHRLLGDILKHAGQKHQNLLDAPKDETDTKNRS